MMYLYKRRSNFIIGFDGRSFNVFFLSCRYSAFFQIPLYISIFLNVKCKYKNGLNTII